MPPSNLILHTFSKKSYNIPNLSSHENLVIAMDICWLWHSSRFNIPFSNLCPGLLVFMLFTNHKLTTKGCGFQKKKKKKWFWFRSSNFIPAVSKFSKKKKRAVSNYSALNYSA